MGAISLLNVTAFSGINVAPHINPVAARLNPASNEGLRKLVLCASCGSLATDRSYATVTICAALVRAARFSCCNP